MDHFYTVEPQRAPGQVIGLTDASEGPLVNQTTGVGYQTLPNNIVNSYLWASQQGIPGPSLSLLWIGLESVGNNVYDPSHPGSNLRPRYPSEAILSTYTDSSHININDLPANPFFGVFNDSQVTDSSGGSAEAAKLDVRSGILGGGIPALSHATGANSVEAFQDRNFDMMNMETGWPQDRLNIQRLNNR